MTPNPTPTATCHPTHTHAPTAATSAPPATATAIPAATATPPLAASARRFAAAPLVAQATVATPLGPLLLARTARGLAGAWFAGQRHHPGVLTADESPDDPLLRKAAAQLAAYFAGERLAFDLPLDAHGTPFQRGVWSALLGIGAGATCSYAAVAAQIGAPAALRAVGAAIGRNPLSVIVPCHRVLGSGGTLTGYAGGLHRKTALLALEGVALRGADAPAGRRRATPPDGATA